MRDACGLSHASASGGFSLLYVNVVSLHQSRHMYTTVGCLDLTDDALKISDPRKTFVYSERVLYTEGRGTGDQMVVYRLSADRKLGRCSHQ